MTTNIYKFEDGRLLVHESRKVDRRYGTTSGTAQSGAIFKIPQVRRIDQVLSLENDYARYGLVTPLSEVRVSNNEIFVVMRRGDLGKAADGSVDTSGANLLLSGMAALGLISGLTSGLAYGAELASGLGAISNVTVVANIIGY